MSDTEEKKDAVTEENQAPVETSAGEPAEVSDNDARDDAPEATPEPMDGAEEQGEPEEPEDAVEDDAEEPEDDAEDDAEEPDGTEAPENPEDDAVEDDAGDAADGEDDSEVPEEAAVADDAGPDGSDGVKPEPEDASSDDASVATPVVPPAKPAKNGWGWKVPVAALVGCAVGAGIMFAANGANAGGKNALPAGTTEVDTDGLDKVMGTYGYNGKEYDVTVKDAIILTSSLDAAKDDKGNDDPKDDVYKVPAADSVLSVARTKVMLADAEEQNVTVSDEDIDKYADSVLGTHDYDTIASQYGMNADGAKDLIKQSATIEALRKKVVEGADEVPDAPEAPTEPKEGKEKDATKEYADYIFKLAGDEWDAEKGAWKDEKSPYAAALASYDVKPDGATYEAAQAAYYVAYQDYSEAQAGISDKWNDYINGLLSKTTITISTAIS